jgi:hypothetical protein
MYLVHDILMYILYVSIVSGSDIALSTPPHKNRYEHLNSLQRNHIAVQMDIIYYRI